MAKSFVSDVFPTSSRCRLYLVGPMASNRSWADIDFTYSARWRKIVVGPTSIRRPRRISDEIGIKSESSRQRGVYWVIGTFKFFPQCYWLSVQCVWQDLMRTFSNRAAPEVWTKWFRAHIRGRKLEYKQQIVTSSFVTRAAIGGLKNRVNSVHICSHSQ